MFADNSLAKVPLVAPFRYSFKYLETVNSITTQFTLEEQEEQLDDEILVLDNEIETAKKKVVVSAQALTTSLTTFGDLYQQATDEERRDLIQLRLNRLIWTPQKIRLAFFPGEGENLVAGVQRDVTVGSPNVGFIEPWANMG